MSGQRSRRTGVRAELAIAKLLGARKVSSACRAGHDLELAIDDDQMLWIEGGVRAAGFGRLYNWLNQRDILIVEADPREPFVVLRISLAVEIAKAGNEVA
jgi:hypothetical protein